jgi:hypothetical protein
VEHSRSLRAAHAIVAARRSLRTLRVLKALDATPWRVAAQGAERRRFGAIGVHSTLDAVCSQARGRRGPGAVTPGRALYALLRRGVADARRRRTVARRHAPDTSPGARVADACVALVHTLLVARARRVARLGPRPAARGRAAAIAARRALHAAPEHAEARRRGAVAVDQTGDASERRIAPLSVGADAADRTGVGRRSAFTIRLPAAVRSGLWLCGLIPQHVIAAAARGQDDDRGARAHAFSYPGLAASHAKNPALSLSRRRRRKGSPVPFP